MPFDPKFVEAQLALNRIATTEMPKLAWDALEAGLDGPATRRLAALDSPTAFEVQKILPQAMQEWQLAQLSPEQAAMRLAKRRAREILRSNDDPMQHAGDFYQMWFEAGYCKELAEYGPLAESVYVERCSGETDDQIRARLLEKLKALAAS
jgi:hypothetical protein